MTDVKKNPEHLQILENWMRALKPEELFDESGKLIPELKELAPAGTRRMGANPHANGGLLKKALRLPDFREYSVKVDKPGQIEAENTRPLGAFLRDVMKSNMDASGSSARTRPPRTSCRTFMKPARNSGSRSIFRKTRTAAN